MRSHLLPSENEEALHQCKALYLGTTIFKPDLKSKFDLSQLQESISQRYPVDGSNYVRGIQTSLSVYPSGIQMEHPSLRDPAVISALFFYPIKSLIYCGALRFITSNDDVKPCEFVPIDSHLAQLDKNSKNPPLFVTLVKGIDTRTRTQVLECHVFIIDTKKTGLSLIESCQKAFNSNSALRLSEFFKLYGNVPILFCMKEDIKYLKKRNMKEENCMTVKKPDLNGYFYSTSLTPICFWRFFEQNDDHLAEKSKSKEEVTKATNKEEYEMSHMGSSHPRIVMRKVRAQSPVMDEKKVLRVTIKGSDVRFESPPCIIIINTQNNDNTTNKLSKYETTRCSRSAYPQLAKQYFQASKSMEMSSRKTMPESNASPIRKIVEKQAMFNNKTIIGENNSAKEAIELNKILPSPNKDYLRDERPPISSIDQRAISKQILELIQPKIKSISKQYQLKSTLIRPTVSKNDETNSTRYRSLIAKDYSYRFTNFEINM